MVMDDAVIYLLERTFNFKTPRIAPLFNMYV